MKQATASAPGKIILFGEHAVVYGQPALAVPLWGVTATARVIEQARGRGFTIDTSHVRRRLSLQEAIEQGNTLGLITQITLDKLERREPDALLSVQSSIPVAAGLGSGAAVSAATAQALAMFLEGPLGMAEQSALVYEVEKLHHGTPSGIDNTVICYAMPVFFVKGTPPETFITRKPFDLLIADTGLRSPTKVAVGAVRELRMADPTSTDGILAEIGQIVLEARHALEAGEVTALGSLMLKNHALLGRLTVSSTELDRLVDAALDAGALGAKLSGGGRGGNMIALANPDDIDRVKMALSRAGAERILHTVIE